MSRLLWGFVASCCLAATGCFNGPAASPVRTTSAARPAANSANQATAPAFAAEEPDPVPEGGHTAADPSERTIPDGFHELKLSGISFVTPDLWKKVRPANQIIEAEYELPPPDGGTDPARLTLMPSGGVPREVIATRAREFNFEPGTGPLIEALKAGETDATWVDFRGEWKGPTFGPIDPRPDYRMLLVIVPFTESSAFYVKLTGPRETVAAREEEFREFVQSARIEPPGRE